MSDTGSSLKYLLACSETSLESFELSRLNRASNLRKELSQVAEEWVDAEVSFRLARLIVERRRADLCSSKPQSKRGAIVTSRGRSTLCLPFPCESDDTDEKNKPVVLGLKPAYKRPKNEKRASACSNEHSTGTSKTICGKKEASQPQTAGVPQAAKSLFASDPAIERTLSRCVAKSVQAATSLRALDVIASGPPAAHPNLPKVAATSPFYLRLGSHAEVPKLPRPSMSMNQRAAAIWKFRRPLHQWRARKMFPKMIEHGRILLSAS